ncbi:MAG: hypothetical protein JJU36_14825 [Phycisphaeraceae bacterium]|nr:hypothetical protein [Phycisphaeraceae bacterium]
MSNTLKLLVAFAIGVGFTFLLGAAVQREQPVQRDTQLVPIMGGLAMFLSVTDHSSQTMFLYQMPQEEKDAQVKLVGSIDLSATGKETLPAKLDFDEEEE